MNIKVIIGIIVLSLVAWNLVDKEKNNISNVYETKKQVQEELKRTAEKVNKYLPNKINKFLEASHNEVIDMTYISHYYIYPTSDKNLNIAQNAISDFQNKIIYSTCSDKYQRGLMKQHKVLFKYDFMDEFGKLSGFILNNEECENLNINIK